MKKKVSLKGNLRLNIITSIFLFVSLIFILRLFSIQVLSHAKYKAMAEEQYWNLQNLPARRGDILSSDGYPMASTQTYYLLYIEPKKVVDSLTTVKKLSEILAEIRGSAEVSKPPAPATEEEVRTKKKLLSATYLDTITSILNSNLLWATVAKNLSPFEKERVEKLNLKGIGFEEEPIRYYPEGTLAANVLGFVAGNEKGEARGYYGIEGNFDGDLKGKPGRIVEEKDALGAPILTGGYKKIDPINGSSISLTINRSVQYIVEKKLKEGVEKYGATWGVVIVMNPQTGDVISMANYPTYDPSNFNEKVESVKNSNDKVNIERRNLGISETYEPGSVMKPFTISTALDLGLVDPQTTFEDKGPVRYSDYYIDNWNAQHYGTQNIIQLLQKSNNIGAAWVGHKVGAKNLHNYLEKFNIGQRSNIDLEGEDSGILRDSATWTDIDLANISFGQGVSATPLQILNGFNSMINGGNLLQPRIVSAINNQGKLITIPTKIIRRVVSAKTSETITDLLVKAEEGGESKYYNLKNYLIGGKTGTAQIPFNGKYDPNKTNATFAGFFAGPKNLSMIVLLNRPTTSVYAAETAVPLWMSIAGDLANYYGMSPDKFQK